MLGSCSLLQTFCLTVALDGPGRWNGVWKSAPRRVPSTSSVGGPLVGNGDVGLTWGVADGKATMYVSKTDFWNFQNDSERRVDQASYILAVGGVTLEVTKGMSEDPMTGYSFEQDIEHGQVLWNVSAGSSLANCGRNIPGMWTIENIGQTVKLQRLLGASPASFYWDNTGDPSSGWGYANGTVHSDGKISLAYHRTTTAGCEPPACGLPTSMGCVCIFNGSFNADCDHLTMDNSGPWHRAGVPPERSQEPRDVIAQRKRPFVMGQTTVSQHGGISTVVTRMTARSSEPVILRIHTWTRHSEHGPSRSGVGVADATSPRGSSGVVWAARDARGNAMAVSVAVVSKLLPCSRCEPVLEASNLSNACDYSSVVPITTQCRGAWINFTLHPGVEATLVHTVVSNYSEAVDPVTSALEFANAVGGADAEQIQADTADFWRRFWNASALSLPSVPTVEAFWWRSQYVLASCSRAGRVAPGLWGAWITTDASEWHGDYTLNYNFQAPFYGVFSSNHAELAATYFDQIQAAVSAVGTADALAYGCQNGVHLPGHFAPGGRVNYGDMGQHSDASFAALNFINMFRYTRNQSFLQKVSYPLLRGVASWWKCWLRRYQPLQDYVYVDVLDCTRETCFPDPSRPNTNPAASISFIRFILNHLVEVVEEGLVAPEPHEVEVWRDILAHLSPIPTGIEAGSGKMILLPQAEPYYWAPGDNPLQLYALYPGEQIGLSTEKELLQAARDTVIMSNAWEQGNAFQETFPAAVRAGVDPQTILSKMVHLLDDRMPPNGYVEADGGGIETAGATIAVNEMLLQSWEGFIRLFPVWPLNQSASFTSLRAVGGFLVSAARTAAGETHSIRVQSEAGQPCTILSPWHPDAIVVIHVASGSIIMADAMNTIVQAGLWYFPTRRGEEYEIISMEQSKTSLLAKPDRFYV